MTGDEFEDDAEPLPPRGLEIAPGITIPFGELEFRFVRSSGPGGQHVNKTSTQVELLFDLSISKAFSVSDKQWLLKRLSTKLDARGVIQIASQEYRSQLRNKKSAQAKLQALLREALLRPKKRKATKPSKSAKENRLKAKKIRGERKAMRNPRLGD